MYRVPEQALQPLDDESALAVIAIANSAQAIQPLTLGEGADTRGAGRPGRSRSTPAASGAGGAGHRPRRRLRGRTVKRVRIGFPLLV